MKSTLYLSFPSLKAQTVAGARTRSWKTRRRWWRRAASI